MHRSILFRVVFVGLIAVTVGSLALAAPAKKRKPSPTPVPTSTPAPEKTVVESGSASVRLWKEEFASRKTITLILMRKSGGDDILRLSPPAAGSYFTDYAKCSAGDIAVEMSNGDPTAEKIPSVAATLAPETFSTLVLRERDGKPVLEVIDDTPVGNDPASAELTVRNFAPGLVEIHVQAGNQLNARLRGATGFLNARGLERRRCQIDTIARDALGKESRWSTEVDFGTSRKATLLILADPYGRIRPRVAPDARHPPSHP